MLLLRPLQMLIMPRILTSRLALRFFTDCYFSSTQASTYKLWKPLSLQRSWTLQQLAKGVAREVATI